MKRLSLILFMSVVTILLCALPAMAVPSTLTVNTLPASNISYNTATLNAMVNFLPASNPNRNNSVITVSDTSGYLADHIPVVNVYFLYGTSQANFTSQTPQQAISGATQVTANIADLQPGTTYYAQAVVVFSGFISNHPGPKGYLMAFLSPASRVSDLREAGVGLDTILAAVNTETVAGNTISFTTLIPSGRMYGQSGGIGTTTQTAPISNIIVQSAAVSTTKVAPGAPVTVTANVANQGTANGSAQIKLYINGQEEAHQGVTLTSGSRTPVKFTVSRDEPAATPSTWATCRLAPSRSTSSPIPTSSSTSAALYLALPS